MKRWFAFGAINGALAVAAGAFAAHGLKTHLTAEMLATFQTGAHYHLIHAVALCVAASLPGSRTARWAAGLFAAGIILFTGSLYLLALTGMRFFGLVTPFGGIAFITGWIVLAVAGLQRKE